jgi:hypothetical protein
VGLVLVLVVVLVLETVAPSVFDLPFNRPPERSNIRTRNRLLTIENEDDDEDEYDTSACCLRPGSFPAHAR